MLKNKLSLNIVYVLFSSSLLTLTSCANVNYNNSIITSTYYNVYDNLISLGIIPNNSHIVNIEKKWNIFPYMEKYTDTFKTKFSQISTSTTQPNLNLLSRLNTDTLVLNEWDKINENKYLDRNIAAKNIAYTSMGDTEEGRDKKQFSNWGFNFKYGFSSWSNALKLLANDLDKRYLQLNHNYNKYIDIAIDIEKRNKKRLDFLRKQVNEISDFKNNNKMKSIGIISGLSGNSGISLPPEEESKISKVFSPFLYPQLYSPDFGLGFDFVDLNNKPESKNYVEPSATIKSIDNGVFKENYKEKFDYILFMKSPFQTMEEAMGIANNFKYLLKNSSKVFKNKIQVIEYEDWYPTTWGAIGNFYLVSKIIDILNKLEPNANLNDETPTWDLNGWPFKKEELIMNPKRLK